jgi:hypothetical protein
LPLQSSLVLHSTTIVVRGVSAAGHAPLSAWTDRPRVMAKTNANHPWTQKTRSCQTTPSHCSNTEPRTRRIRACFGCAYYSPGVEPKSVVLSLGVGFVVSDHRLEHGRVTLSLVILISNLWQHTRHGRHGWRFLAFDGRGQGMSLQWTCNGSHQLRMTRTTASIATLSRPDSIWLASTIAMSSLHTHAAGNVHIIACEPLVVHKARLPLQAS